MVLPRLILPILIQVDLGRQLLTRVRDKMCTENLPFVDPKASVQDALMVMTEGRLGLALVSMRKTWSVLLPMGFTSLAGKTDIAITAVSDVASQCRLPSGLMK